MFRSIVAFIRLCVLLCILSVGCTSGKSLLHVETTSADILYAGLEQVLRVEPPCRNCSVTTDRGWIRMNADGSFTIFPDTLPGTLAVNFKNQRFGQEFAFRIKPVPDPEICILADTTVCEETHISASNMKTFRFIQARLKNVDVPCKMEILSYRIKRTSRDGTVEAVFVDHPQKGPNESNELASRAQSGDLYEFQDIRLKISGVEEQSVSHHRSLPDKLIHIR